MVCSGLCYYHFISSNKRKRPLIRSVHSDVKMRYVSCALGLRWASTSITLVHFSASFDAFLRRGRASIRKRNMKV